MFKRKNPFDRESGLTSVGSDPQPTTLSSPYREAPPRIFEKRPLSSSQQGQSFPQDEMVPLPEDEDFQDERWKRPATMHGQNHSLEIEEPETILGEGVVIKGQLKFRRYLRIDGEFEGELISEGKLVVGPNGVVRSNIDLREAVIEGRIEGNVTTKERLELRGEAKVFGNIQTKLLSIDEGVTVIGQVIVRPQEEERSLPDPD